MLSPNEKEEIEEQIHILKKQSDSFKNNLEPQKKHNVILQYAHLGIEFIGIFLVFLFGGKFIDDKFHASPIFTLIGVIIGFSMAMFRIVQVAKKLEKELDENDNN